MLTQPADSPSHVPRAVVGDVDIYGIQSIAPDIHTGWKKLSLPLQWEV